MIHKSYKMKGKRYSCDHTSVNFQAFQWKPSSCDLAGIRSPIDSWLYSCAEVVQWIPQLQVPQLLHFRSILILLFPISCAICHVTYVVQSLIIEDMLVICVLLLSIKRDAKVTDPTNKNRKNKSFLFVFSLEDLTDAFQDNRGQRNTRNPTWLLTIL